MAFEAMVRNLIDLSKECIRRMLRAARKGIRREFLADYALLPREDGPPAWFYLNSFDMLSGTGFRHAEFIPRFDAKFENGLLNNALKSGLSCLSPTEGETVPTVTGLEGGGGSLQYPIPGLLSEVEAKLSLAHAPSKDDTSI